jgi:protein-S-isoprenylcysteine O-methyltransferase Ste14
MQPDLHRYIYACWIAVAMVWLIGVFLAKRTARKQSPGSRLFQIGIAALAFFFFYGNRRSGWMAQRFVPATPAIAWLGLFLTIAGCALAILARLYLGGNWSGTVTIKQDHTLIRTGPYALVRNPIYTGFLVAVLGSAIANGHLRDLVATGVLLLAFVYKIHVEEKFMTEQFGDQYLQYKHETKALIPYVW